MNRIVRYFRLCTLLCVGFLFKNTFGATDIEKADSLFAAKKYFEASVYYERADFFSKSDKEKLNAMLQNAECFRLLMNYSKARDILSRIDLSTLNDTSLYSVQYKQALYSYLLKDYGETESHLLQISYYIADTTLYKNFFPLYALTLNELYRWNEASEKLIKWSKASSLTWISDSLHFYYNNQMYPHLKDPKKAQRLSIIPGIGQIYAGEFFWDGFTNVSLQTVFLGYTIWSIYSGFYVTAGLIGYGFLQKFHSGGITHVEYLVNKSNYNKTRKYNDMLRSFILNTTTARQ